MTTTKTKKILLNKQEITYTFRRYRLSRKLKIVIRSDATILVSAPMRFSERRAEKFLREKADWLLERVNFFKKQGDKKEIKTTKADYIKQKENVRKVISHKLVKLNEYYDFKYNRVSIRNQKTRWGSCSGKGNLNFNYRLIYLSEKLFDYVIVHELCHLREMNHSVRFWNLVAETVPDYRAIRRELKKEGLLLF